MTLTPNDFYGRSCEVEGHILGDYEDIKRCIFCGEFNNQQEDKTMDTISWKDIIESQYTELDEHGMPEDMYVDPAESTPDEQ